MINIKLKTTQWNYDPNKLIGEPGGFGAVFYGEDKNGNAVAVKKLHSTIGKEINRELRFAEELMSQNHNHVMAYLDYGEDIISGEYFIVMPKAEYSLNAYISAHSNFDEKETVSILFQILKGLIEIKHIVHRDLKPGNILFHSGKWKISDLGISKVIEESTSINTQKSCLSIHYAAPEQWNLENTSNKTDLYALGCIGYCLLTGNPPFTGSDYSELRKKHLSEAPHEIKGISNQLNSMLLSLLRKSQENRPSIERVFTFFENYKNNSNINSGGLKALEEANVKEILLQVKSEAKQNQDIVDSNYRRIVAKEAINILENVKDVLFEKILNAAPSAKSSKKKDSKSTTYMLTLGSANLLFKIFDTDDFVQKGKMVRSKWDILKVSMISILQHKNKDYQWSSNIVYTDEGKGNDFRWLEVNFMTHPLMPQSMQYEPFAVDSIGDIDRAIGVGMESIQLASTPKYIDDENIDDFCSRWADLFARAYNGLLQKPNSMPYD
ncbi:MAG: serine/threonine protein kinase [Bacteroidetes bacterium]|nr:serine/threonine protein kinase [Bacteroidota bacterium]